MRHRLSPLDTTVVVILGSTDDEPLSGRGMPAVMCGSCATTASCRDRFVPVVPGTLNDTSARDWSPPELDVTSSTATATSCFDVASVPSGNLVLNVSS